MRLGPIRLSRLHRRQHRAALYRVELIPFCPAMYLLVYAGNVLSREHSDLGSISPLVIRSSRWLIWRDLIRLADMHLVVFLLDEWGSNLVTVLLLAAPSSMLLVSAVRLLGDIYLNVMLLRKLLVIKSIISCMGRLDHLSHLPYALIIAKSDRGHLGRILACGRIWSFQYGTKRSLIPEIVVSESSEHLSIVGGRRRRHNTKDRMRICQIGLCPLCADGIVQFDRDKSIHVCEVPLREDISCLIHACLNFGIVIHCFFGFVFMYESRICIIILVLLWISIITLILLLNRLALLDVSWAPGIFINHDLYIRALIWSQWVLWALWIEELADAWYAFCQSCLIVSLITTAANANKLSRLSSVFLRALQNIFSMLSSRASILLHASSKYLILLLDLLK